MGPYRLAGIAAATAALTLAATGPATGGHHPRRLGPVHRVLSSAYCYSGTTKSERHTRFGYVATYPGRYHLGTRLRLVRPRSIRDPVTGARRSTFQVMDRGYSPLDIWFTPGPGVHESGCGWGRRWVSYRVVR